MDDDPDEGVEDNIQGIQHTMFIEGLREGPGVHTKTSCFWCSVGGPGDNNKIMRQRTYSNGRIMISYLVQLLLEQPFCCIGQR